MDELVFANCFTAILFLIFALDVSRRLYKIHMLLKKADERAERAEQRKHPSPSP